jgi:transposase InsO family protein
VWAIDFKGWFLTGDGTHCEPLTLSDAHSRYLLRCQVLPKSDAEHVWPVLDATFREFGLPERLRSDNGPPFACTGAGGLSRLAVLLVKAGVTPERIAPGKPQQNGRLERLHLTLLQDTATPPARSLREQLRLLPSTPLRASAALANGRRVTRVAGRFDGCCASELRAARQRVRTTARSNGRAISSTSTPLWPASRSGSRKARTAPGASATARSRSASSIIAATA